MITAEVFAFVDHIMRSAQASAQRPGQYLFNTLPFGAGDVVAATLWDPFHTVTTKEELIDWVDNHLIFDGIKIIGIFNKDQILYSRKS